MAAFFVSYIDRVILSLLVEPIKHSLHLTDTQIGLLQGIAFGIFFTLATFPAGWLADKGNRMRLVACGLALWSLMTVLGGFCANFAQIFLTRMGLAIGEASLQPTAPSVIADSFPPEKRTPPLSVYSLGAGMGASVSLLAGGLVASLVGARATVAVPFLGELEPWRVILIVVGLPGFVVSLLFFLAKEPKRHEAGGAEGTMAELGAALKSRRGVIAPHFAGVCLQQVYAYAYTAWAPVFFMRRHGWSLVDVGLKYGAVQLTAGICGASIGGTLARALWRRGRREANLLTVAITYCCMLGPALLGTLVDSGVVAALLLGVVVAFLQAPGGPTVAAIQEIMPNRVRARVTALYYALSALSGMTLGPIVIGVLNDRVFTGPAGVGKSMSLTAAVTLPLAIGLLFLAASRRRKLDLAA
jgi:MFS family permease